MALRDPLDFNTTRQYVFDGVEKAFSERYPIENDQYRMELSNVGYTGKDKFSLKDQKRAILSRSALARSIKGTVNLIDKKTNTPVDSKKITLAKVPYMTRRGTFILGGSEYTVAQQMRLRPGVYTRVKDNGELEAHFNVVKGGPSFRVFMDSDSGVFKMQIGQSKLPLYPILQAAGVSEKSIREQWGPELLAANIEKSKGSNIVSKAWARLAQARAKKDVGQPVAKDFADVFGAMELDPQVTQHTLGQPYSRATPDTILRATQKLININKGSEDTDDRDSLMYQTTWSVDDLLKERITRDSGRVLSQQLWKATMRKNLSGMPSQLHTSQLDSVFYKSGLGQPLEEINTLDAMDQALRITRLGEGGIPSKDSIPDEARSVQPSHFGYIDPIKTAESSSIGVDTRMAAGAMKGDDNQLYTSVLDIKNGVVAKVPPEVLIDSVVSFPGELESAIAEKRKYVKAMRGGKMEYVKRGEVDYEMPSASSMFTQTSNMTPLTAGIKGGRLLMGAKFITQALPLRDAEVPLVQPADADGKSSLYRRMGKYLGNAEADAPGQVVVVTPAEVTVKGRDGTTKSYDLYDRFPLNRKSVSGDTRIVVLLSTGGVWRGRISDYTWADGDKVLSIDPSTQLSSWMRIKGYEKLACDKHMYRVTYASGRHVDVTEDHSLMTLDSQGLLAPILPADAIIGATKSPIAAVPSTADSTDDCSIDMAILAGLYLAEGHIPPAQPNLITIAAADSAHADYAVKLLGSVSDGRAPYVTGGAACLTSPAISAWLRSTFGHLSAHKTIPNVCFTWPAEHRAALISGYFAGDGCLHEDRNGVMQLYGVTTSVTLRDALVDMLATFSIFSTIMDMPRAHINPNWRDAYGFRVLNKDIHKLDTWFAYPDRQAYLRSLLKQRYRASYYDQIPVTKSRNARSRLYSEFTGAVPRYIYKTASMGHVHKARVVACTGQYGRWGRSDVMWDTVISVEPIPPVDFVYDLCVDKAEAFCVNGGILVHNTLMNSTPRVKPGDIVSPGQLLASTNFTSANGEAAIGKNLRTAYVPLRGLNYEDAIAISESAAQKMTSEHMYTAKIDIDNMSQVDRNKFTGSFPTKYTKDQYKKVGTDGVVRVGQIVNEGDPLILATTTKTPRGAGMLHRGGDYSTADASVTWDHASPGMITDTWTEKDGVKVAVQTFAPAKKGDKLAGFYGDKGVISKVIPDDQMPTDEEGNPIEVALNPLGIITRTNPAQVVEAVLGKIAAKTGKPYVIPGFSDKNLIDFAIKEMEANGVKDTENLKDPVTGKTIPDVLVGRRYMLKLHHTAEAKISDRAMGSYSMEGAPAYSEEEGNPKRVGMGEMQALISHGAINNIRDIKSIKGQRNDDYWRAMSLGYEPPTPNVPSAYKKFLTLLQASGVNVNRKGDYLHLTAMTDKDVDALSSGEIKEPSTVKWMQEYKRGVFGDKSMEPIKGGLFDRGITGGHGGNRFSHIKLSEPVPNPVMEDPIRRLLGMTKKQYEDVIAGDTDIPGFGSGGKAIKTALSRINVKKSMGDLKDQIRSATSASARDDAVKKLGYLTAMDKHDVNPGDLVISKVPVLPPIFRPITSTSKFDLVAGPNLLYADLMNADSQLKAASSVLEGQPVADARRNVYKALKAAVGLGDPIKPKHVQQNVRGVLSSVFGPNSPKTGMFQRRLLGTGVDMAGRSVITPNPALNIDQVGIPEDSAWKLYGPFVVRRMVQSMGGDRDAKIRAITLVANRDDAARKVLEKEMSTRPVLATRAPALHRYSLMGFMPTIARGNTMELSPATTPGFGADFDGDENIGKALFLVKTTAFYRQDNNRYKTLTSRWVRVNLSSMKTNNTSIPAYNAATHTLVVADLEDFPHGELDRSIDGVKGPIEFYHVPAGIYVVAHDNVTNKLEWVQAAYWSKHTQRDIEVVNLRNKAQIITDDDPRAVYGVPSDAVELSRATPTDAARRGFAIPYAKAMPELSAGLATDSVPFEGWPVTSAMPLNVDTGYWLGAMAGDGWWCKRAYDTVSGSLNWQWHIADLNGFNAARLSAFTLKYFGTDIRWHRHEQPATSDSTRYGDTIKYTASSAKYGKPVCDFLSEHLGGDRDDTTSGSGNKRLPAFAFTAPREFRESMLCGLIDTDGTVCVSNGKVKPQLMISFTSTSLRLCRDVRLLCRTLGISATISFSKTTTAGNDAWILTLSTVDCKRNPFLSKLESPWKREAFNTTIVDAGSPAAAAQDMVPFPAPVADALMAELGAVRVPEKSTVPAYVYDQLRARMTIFTSCCGYKKRNIMTRTIATKLIAAVAAAAAERELDKDKAVRYLKIVTSDTVFSGNDASIVRAAISAVAPKWGDESVYAAGAKLRVNINSAARKQRISQATAVATLEWLQNTTVATNLHIPAVQTWLSWVTEDAIRWTTVDSVEKTGQLEDGYDLTVPGYETFMDEQGIILSNTMNFHVVVSDKAIKEAKEKLLPSRSLRSASNFEPLWAPRQEFLQGLYTASTSRSGKKMVPKMKSAMDIIQAYKRGEVDVEDVVSFD